MALTRSASATWQGDLPSGEGTVSAASEFLTDAPTSWKARTEDATGKTSPEELLAAAHASCFSMAFSNELSKAGFVPDRVEVTVDVTADKRRTGLDRAEQPHNCTRMGPERRRGDIPGDGQQGQGRLSDLARSSAATSR